MDLLLSIIIFGGMLIWSIRAIIKNKKESENTRLSQPLRVDKRKQETPQAVVVMLESQAQVISDSYNLITTSSNLETVVNRYNFLKRFLDEAVSDVAPYDNNQNTRNTINHYVKLKTALVTQEGELIKKAIERAVLSEQGKARQLKTAKGYEQRMARFIENAKTLLPEYKEEIDYLVQGKCLSQRRQEYTDLSKFKYKSERCVKSLTSFISLDLETTGLYHDEDRIIQISAIRINRETGEMQEYLTYVNPEIPIPLFITELTGITNEDVKEAPRFQDVAENLLAFLGDSVIFAHNASFDMKFLLSNFNRLGMEINNMVCCTVGMSKHFFPELGNYKLDTVARFLGIEQFAHHTASEDAMVCAQIALRCLSKVGEASAEFGEDWVQEAPSNASWERRKLIEKNMAASNLSTFDTYYTGIMLVQEYRPEEGEAYIRKAIEKEPQTPLFYEWLSKALVKQNRLDDALSILYDYRKTDHYKSGIVNTCIGRMDMKNINLAIADIETKKARGYVYRPRRQRIN